MIELKEVINDEQLLDFALSHICEKDTEEVHPVAEQIVILYIINNTKGEEFTDEYISEKYRELIADYVLCKMEKNGLIDMGIDESGEFVYSLSEKGRDKINGS
jgi:hypothetical protein